jgi:hypothetical protein
MRRISSIGLAVLFFLVVASGARAETFELTDGTTVSGELILPASVDGVNIRISSGNYQRVPWGKFTQETLVKLAKNDKLAEFVEPLILPPEDERVKKTTINVRPIQRLERQEKGSLFGALFQSSVGLFVLAVCYGASLFAAYEISVVRTLSPVLVCGVSAVLPIVGQIIFLCVPTQRESTREKPTVHPAATAAVAPTIPAVQAQAGGMRLAAVEAHAVPSIPETQIFQRGKFTLNRRFFETKFSGFFGVVRRDAEKDLILIIKTPKAEYIANRITRITGNDIHLDVRKGGGTQEISLSFTDIIEVRLKHKDAQD